jgi:hypothetical protein
MLPQGNPTSNIILILVLPLGRRFLIFLFFTTGRLCYSFFLLSYFQRKPAQKTNRPQARPLAKESVMIPTLFMNIPTPPTTTKHNICLRLALVFASFLLFYFVVLLRHGDGQGIHKNGIEVEE